MYGKVKRLRVRGKRLTDRKIAQVEPVEGEFKMAGRQWTMERVLSLYRHNDNNIPSMIPPLIDPKVTAMHHGGMLLVGLERPDGDDGPAFMQEWSIRLDAL